MGRKVAGRAGRFPGHIGLESRLCSAPTVAARWRLWVARGIWVKGRAPKGTGSPGFHATSSPPSLQHSFAVCPEERIARDSSSQHFLSGEVTPKALSPRFLIPIVSVAESAASVSFSFDSWVSSVCFHNLSLVVVVRQRFA